MLILKNTNAKQYYWYVMQKLSNNKQCLYYTMVMLSNSNFKQWKFLAMLMLSTAKEINQYSERASFGYMYDIKKSTAV